MNCAKPTVSQAPLLRLFLEPALGSGYWNAGETDPLEGGGQPKERNWGRLRLGEIDAVQGSSNYRVS